MPTIRIDDDVYLALQQQATAFVDTPNDVLRRVLKLDIAGDADGGAARAGSLPFGEPRRRGPRMKMNRTREPAFRLPILRALARLGGSAPVRQVLAEVEKELGATLTSDDRVVLPSTGEKRWQNTASWERKNLVDEGLMTSTSRHGVWEISPKGTALLNSGSR